MARPRIYQEARVVTAIRLPVSVRAELQRVAAARSISVSALVSEAVVGLLHSQPHTGPGEPASRSTSA